MTETSLNGFRAFVVVWLGQLASVLGSAMTSFAIILFTWDATGSATAVALVGVAAFAPTILFSPMAGTLVDRWSRKRVMVLADLGSSTSTAAILALYLTGGLEVWHLYPAVAVAGIFNAFHFPAFSAAVTLMIPKQHYARASGMLSLAGSLSGLFAPIAAALLLRTVGIVFILAVDLVTFMAAVLAILIVHIPQPAATAEGVSGRGGFWKETAYGLRYILQRPSLLGLQLIFFGLNLVASFAFILLYPMILLRTGNDEIILASVLSAGALGQIAGGALLGIWGGPKKRIHGVLLGMVFSSLFGEFILGVGREWLVWAAASFLGSLFIIIVNGSNQAIWQSKVAPDVQGRVFAFRRLIAQVSAPIAMAAAGPIADGVFEPGMAVGGNLTPLFGWLLGTGPGTGMAAMFVITGLLGILVGGAGYAFRSVRDVETILPDHEGKIAEE